MPQGCTKIVIHLSELQSVEFLLIRSLPGVHCWSRYTSFEFVIDVCHSSANSAASAQLLRNNKKAMVLGFRMSAQGNLN